MPTGRQGATRGKRSLLSWQACWHHQKTRLVFVADLYLGGIGVAFADTALLLVALVPAGIGLHGMGIHGCVLKRLFRGGKTDRVASEK